MGLFDRFKKKTAAGTREDGDTLEIAVYSGMRVEVTTLDGDLLFVARLAAPREDRAELYQFSETEASEAVRTEEEEPEPLRVKIRGYHDRQRKAVYMEGTITPRPNHVWQVDDLEVERVANDRAFFRLSTNVDATATTFGGINAGERPCKLLNISIGGACIASDFPYQEGDKFLLKVRILADRDVSTMYCQVLRIIDKGKSGFEYGCRFLELPESEQEKITQNIYAVQRKQRGII